MRLRMNSAGGAGTMSDRYRRWRLTIWRFSTCMSFQGIDILNSSKIRSEGFAIDTMRAGICVGFVNRRMNERSKGAWVSGKSGKFFRHSSMSTVLLRVRSFSSSRFAAKIRSTRNRSAPRSRFRHQNPTCSPSSSQKYLHLDTLADAIAQSLQGCSTAKRHIH